MHNANTFRTSMQLIASRALPNRSLNELLPFCSDKILFLLFIAPIPIVRIFLILTSLEVFVLLAMMLFSRGEQTICFMDPQAKIQKMHKRNRNKISSCIPRVPFLLVFRWFQYPLGVANAIPFVHQVRIFPLIRESNKTHEYYCFPWSHKSCGAYSSHYYNDSWVLGMFENDSECFGPARLFQDHSHGHFVTGNIQITSHYA